MFLFPPPAAGSRDHPQHPSGIFFTFDRRGGTLPGEKDSSMSRQSRRDFSLVATD
jgi:hypothetical protein